MNTQHRKAPNKRWKEPKIVRRKRERERERKRERDWTYRQCWKMAEHKLTCAMYSSWHYSPVCCIFCCFWAKRGGSSRGGYWRCPPNDGETAVNDWDCWFWLAPCIPREGESDGFLVERSSSSIWSACGCKDNVTIYSALKPSQHCTCIRRPDQYYEVAGRLTRTH